MKLFVLPFPLNTWNTVVVPGSLMYFFFVLLINMVITVTFMVDG